MPRSPDRHGNYTGCSFGYGDVPPFDPPCDCPTCEGSGYEGPVGTTFAHTDFGGDPDCCGCLIAVIRGREAVIVCNECSAEVRSVPVADLQRTLDEMELSLDVCAEMCPHCGKVNVFPGWSSMMAYTCRGCGEVVRTSDDPNIEKFFGPSGAVE
jgi:hypothetical protein